MKSESKFISLLSDYGFKATFADESNTLFVKTALQALIQSAAPIREVQFLRNEFVGITKEARGGVFDLLCIDEQERTFIVEMQLGYYKHFIQRAKFYAFQRFNTLVERGEYQFDNLTPIYCIGFLAKGIFPKSKEYYHFGRLKNQEGEELDDQITHIIVEINKFEKTESEIETDLDKLIYIMKNLENIKGIDELPEFLTEDWIEQAMAKIDKSQMTPEQRMHYEMMMARNASIIAMRKEERERIAAEVEEAANKKVEAANKEVEAANKEVEAAKKKVEAANKEALEKAKKMAKALKDEGLELSLIAKITELSIEELERL